MTKLSSKLNEESLALLPSTIFFFVALHIVAFVRVLMLKGTGISPLSSMSVAVAAVILGKAALIADMVPMINRFPNKPLIYNVAWKTLIYLLAATLIHYLERLSISGGKLAASWPAIRSYWLKSCGRISGLSRSFCSC